MAEGSGFAARRANPLLRLQELNAVRTASLVGVAYLTGVLLQAAAVWPAEAAWTLVAPALLVAWASGSWMLRSTAAVAAVAAIIGLSEPVSDAGWAVAGVSLAGVVATGLALHRLTGDLVAARAAVRSGERDLVAQRQAFVQSVSNEFRTPLTVLRGTLETLARDPDLVAEPVRELVPAANRAVERVTYLTTTMLAVVESDGGMTPADQTVVHLAAAVGDLIARLPIEEAARVDLRIDPAAVAVVTNPVAMRLAIQSLLDNALAHTPASTDVVVTSRSERERVEIDVRDFGPGIAEDQRERVFEPFHRGIGAPRRGGAGLGLFLARRQARRLGGDIALLAPDGPGLVARLWVPTRRLEGSASTRGGVVRVVDRRVRAASVRP